MKRILLLACCILLLAGCNKGKELTDVKAVGDLMGQEETLPTMQIVSNDKDLFTYISDVDYDLIDSYYLAYSADGLADEIIIVRVKNNKNLETVKESIKDHMDSRIKLYRSYNPKQVTRVESGKLFTYENDVILVVCDNQDKLEKIYKENIEK